MPANSVSILLVYFMQFPPARGDFWGELGVFNRPLFPATAAEGKAGPSQQPTLVVQQSI